MRKLAIVFLLIASLGASAQTDTKKLTLVKAQWPTKGANPGEGIIGKPGIPDTKAFEQALKPYVR